MKLSDLEEELKRDLVLDRTKLIFEAANNPVIYGKWIAKYSNIKKEILALNAQRKKAHKDKLDYYTGRSDDVCMDRYERSELKVVLSADETILHIETKIELLTISLEFCSNAIEAIKNRGFAIKNVIDLRKFESGE